MPREGDIRGVKCCMGNVPTDTYKQKQEVRHLSRIGPKYFPTQERKNQNSIYFPHSPRIKNTSMNYITVREIQLLFLRPLGENKYRFDSSAPSPMSCDPC